MLESALEIADPLLTIDPSARGSRYMSPSTDQTKTGNGLKIASLIAAKLQ
jgi:hypothetical protein